MTIIRTAFLLLASFVLTDARRLNESGMNPFYLTESESCPSGYRPARVRARLTGDLNEDAGGKYIFLCESLNQNHVKAVKLVQKKSRCDDGWELASAESGLTGDLNQGAGGEYIYLCFSRLSANDTSGQRIVRLDIVDYKPSQDRMAELPDGLNGDLNEDAGGEAIYLELYRENFVPKTAIYLSSVKNCPMGYRKPMLGAGLGGDLNQGSGGKYIYMCLAFDKIPVYGVKLVQKPDQCGVGWELAENEPTFTGDLNQDSGGKHIYLCYTRSQPNPETQPLDTIYLRQSKPPIEKMPLLPDGLTGDLNEGSGGEYIYLDLYQEDNESTLPGINSLPAVTTYDFGSNPKPGFTPVEVCGGVVGIEISCTNYGPCWHVQQLVTFADSDNLYTFHTNSQSRHGRAYLLKTPLTKEASASRPAVSSKGTVQWYGETTNYNHPGDVVIKDRIILTANQNWDPTDFWEDFGCGFAIGASLGGGGCSCISDLASKGQALTIWDFGSSLTSPKKYNINKWDFDAVITGDKKMDGTDADNLWGGDVDGELVIEFEGFWFHWTGGDLGDVYTWREVEDVDIPSCSGEVGTGAGMLFTKINGTSVLASFDVDNPCYSLRTVTYNKDTNSLSAPCASLETVCTPGGQEIYKNDRENKKRAYQTITEGPDGRVYITAVNIDGESTTVMASGAGPATTSASTTKRLGVLEALP